MQGEQRKVLTVKNKIAIIDFGMGNLFSIKNACAKAGLEAEITHDQNAVLRADAIILPGVGAFGKAMDTLEQYGLLEAIKAKINDGSPFVGICIGLQLLMEESEEFGTHKGLGIIKGKVIRFQDTDHRERIKVPHVGWNRVKLCRPNYEFAASLMSGIRDEEYFYFVHSYHVVPEDRSVILSVTKYGGKEFCSSIHYQNIFACQYHPERSGVEGLKIYQNLADYLANKKRS